MQEIVVEEDEKLESPQTRTKGRVKGKRREKGKDQEAGGTDLLFRGRIVGKSKGLQEDAMGSTYTNRGGRVMKLEESASTPRRSREFLLLSDPATCRISY